eukprot:TRINITY_DN7866_c1_g1_i2.p1 TRINITY_DN7866_c1_g1~~TRINITY_DN7866_c1_g1_i2.p1  ORF type:complete len:150 (-),score=39.10 TRINITY_DN7866_c1_g1_i2:38-487(-)
MEPSFVLDTYEKIDDFREGHAIIFAKGMLLIACRDEHQCFIWYCDMSALPLSCTMYTLSTAMALDLGVDPLPENVYQNVLTVLSAEDEIEEKRMVEDNGDDGFDEDEDDKEDEDEDDADGCTTRIIEKEYMKMIKRMRMRMTQMDVQQE